MTEEEREQLVDGDKVILVGNIEYIVDAMHGDDDHVLKNTFIPGEVYEVDIGLSHDNWIAIKKNASGNDGHGWPNDRWLKANEPIVDIYKHLGMEVDNVGGNS